MTNWESEGWSRCLCLCVAVSLTLAGLMFAKSWSGNAEAATKPRVVCLNHNFETFRYETRPTKCDYYVANGPIPPTTVLALVISRKMHWSHWGHTTALGRGEYHPTGAGYWTPARFKLSRPARACDGTMFTSVQVKLKFAGQPWPKSWGRRTKLKTCT